jgi:hypothetical protein
MMKRRETARGRRERALGTAERRGGETTSIIGTIIQFGVDINEGEYVNGGVRVGLATLSLLAGTELNKMINKKGLDEAPKVAAKITVGIGLSEADDASMQTIQKWNHVDSEGTDSARKSGDAGNAAPQAAAAAIRTSGTDQVPR